MDLVYGEYKAKILVSDAKNGKFLHEFTTWREDFINNIVNSVPFDIDKGSNVKIEMGPNPNHSNQED
jgi:hypothetical protein